MWEPSGSRAYAPLTHRDTGDSPLHRPDSRHTYMDYGTGTIIDHGTPVGIPTRARLRDVRVVPYTRVPGLGRLLTDLQRYSNFYPGCNL